MANTPGATPKHAANTPDAQEPEKRQASSQGQPRARAAKAVPVVTTRVKRVSGPSSGAVMTSTGVSRRTAATTRRAKENVGGGSRRKREQRSMPIIAFAVIGALIIGASAFFSRGLFTQPDETPQIEPGLEVKITIPEGAGGSEIANILIENGVVYDSAEFFREVKQQEAETQLKSGTYSFITGANTREVVKQLVEGPNSMADVVTIPEGYTIRQIAAVCEEVLEIPADEFIARAVASNYVNDYPFLVDVANDSLEGYLFPKTYDFGGKDKSADGVIRTMLNQYQAEVSGLDFEAARNKIAERYDISVSDYDLITMASIIEKEASIDEERADVASVFYNRMMTWMPLQSDATVGYVIDHQVSAEDLELDSEYNTYIYYGLTPTPICNPGIESIKAALNPNETNYYYFLLIDDGDYQKHVFSETYDEHLQAIAEAEQDYS